MTWWLFLLAIVVSRPYHHETVDSMVRSRHTHVQVAGTVTLVRREADGDIHFRISDDKGRFVVCEIIPAISMAAPLKGQAVVVFGIRRVDTEHGWPEIHPVEKWIEATPFAREGQNDRYYDFTRPIGFHEQHPDRDD